MILTNLLSNVENLPKIGRAEVVVPYTEGVFDAPSEGVRGAVGPRAFLMSAVMLSLPSVFLVGPRVPVGASSPSPRS